MLFMLQEDKKWGRVRAKFPFLKCACQEADAGENRVL